MAVLIFMFLAGCGKKHIVWKEEVQLSNGDVIVVERRAEGSMFKELGGPSGIKDMRMIVSWKGVNHVNLPPDWNFPYVPMLVDYDESKNEWLLVASFYMCEDWYGLGRPKLPYIEYRSRHDSWENIPLGPELFGRPANMLTAPDFGGQSSFVKLKDKEIPNSEMGQKFIRVIDNWKTGC